MNDGALSLDRRDRAVLTAWMPSWVMVGLERIKVAATVAKTCSTRRAGETAQEREPRRAA